MEIASLIALLLLLLAGAGLGLAAWLVKRRPPVLRDIPAFRQIQRSISMVVEDGSRLHVSLGHGSFLTPFGASALAGLSMLRQLAENTSLSDRPSVASSGEGVLNLAAQDTLRSAHEALKIPAAFDMNRGQLTGLTPFSYAAGTLPQLREADISSTVLIGHFGPEAALLAEGVERASGTLIAASDSLTAQAIFYAATPNTPLGEELFAAGAYHQAGQFHTASLLLQDVLRWLLILSLLIGAILKTLGVF